MKYEMKMIAEKNLEIKVLFESEEEFDDAFASLRSLASRYRLLQRRSELERFWDSEGDTRVLSQQVADTTHRLALCLLDSYPTPKPTSLVAQQVGLTDGAASNNLSGRYGGAGHLFERTEDGWTLSVDGLRITTTEILPTYREEVGTR